MLLFERLRAVPIWAHGLATAMAFGAFQGVRIRLDEMYAASNHPVDFATGQTGFDGQEVKSFYAHMQELATLDLYVDTQLFDFLFMASVALFGVLFGTFVARFARDGSWGRKLALSASGLAVTGALLDACENAVSFVMLANPQGFANWLAYPYSGFAVAKFAMLTLAMAAIILAIIWILVGRLVRPTSGNA